MVRTWLPSVASIYLLVCWLPTASTVKFSAIDPCSNPLGGENGIGDTLPCQGIAIQVSASEFYESFASIFRLSDGSSISVPAQERAESLRYMQELLYAVGVYVNETASEELAKKNDPSDVLQVCGKDVIRILLLAAVGNFVAGPGDANISPQSSMKSMPSVVIDAYTGQLVMHTPYDAVRGYFVEALLVISIIVISRLTFIRNNVYSTVVHSSLPAPSEMGDGSNDTTNSYKDG